MSIYATIQHNGTLTPSSESDLALIQQLPVRVPIEFELVQKHIKQYEQQFNALLEVLIDVDEIEEEFLTIEFLKPSLLMSSGYYTGIPNFKKKMAFQDLGTYIPQEMEFDYMSENEFDFFYNKIMGVVLTRLDHMTRDDLDLRVKEVLGNA